MSEKPLVGKPMLISVLEGKKAYVECQIVKRLRSLISYTIFILFHFLIVLKKFFPKQKKCVYELFTFSVKTRKQIRPKCPTYLRGRAFLSCSEWEPMSSWGAWGLLPSFLLVVSPGSTVTLVFPFRHTDLSAVPGPSCCLRAGLSLSQTRHLPENRICWTLPSHLSSKVKLLAGFSVHPSTI